MRHNRCRFHHRRPSLEASQGRTLASTRRNGTMPEETEQRPGFEFVVNIRLNSKSLARFMNYLLVSGSAGLVLAHLLAGSVSG